MEDVVEPGRTLLKTRLVGIVIRISTWCIELVESKALINTLILVGKKVTVALNAVFRVRANSAIRTASVQLD
jgi:hypothetical protein